MKTIVVTGGAGFIGSHLCEFLLSKGNKVIAIDNFATGRRENISGFADNKNFTLLEHDITKKIPLKERVHAIYNLASLASPLFYQKMPLETLLVNSLGTLNALELAKKNNAKFLQASTSEVYGDPLQHPQKESYYGNVNTVGARSCYDEGKRFAETAAMEYGKKYGLEIRIARIFNTYGPRMRSDDGRVVPNFIVQALQGKPLTVYGKGKQTRSFCYISDQVAGLTALMGSDYAMPVNIGNPEEITILTLAEKIKSLTGSESEIKFLPLPEDDPARRRADISLAREKLGWQPKVPLEDGLEKTVEWFKTEPKQ